MGYSTDAKAYRIYILDSGKIVVSRDVVCLEIQSWDWKGKQKIDEQKSDMKKIIFQEVKSKQVENGENGEGSSNDVQHSGGNESFSGQFLEFGAERKVDDSPIQRVRTIRDIYESSSFALTITDLEKF